MLVNADATLYEKDTFKRHELHGIYWNDSRGASVSKNGVQISDSVIVYIYDSNHIPKAGDIIVRGIIDFSFGEGTKSADMKRFRQLYPSFAAVKAVNDCNYGGLSHIEITAG